MSLKRESRYYFNLSRCCMSGSVCGISPETDYGHDYDDVGAPAILHAPADSGKVEILATISSNKDEIAVPCIEVINTYFNRSYSPVGSACSNEVIRFTDCHTSDCSN